MVPVNEVASEGQPSLFIRNLPPVSTAAPRTITQPRIYFGERRRPLRHRPAPARPSSTTRRERATAGGDADDPLDGHDRHPAGHDAEPAAVRAPLPRPRPADQRPDHGRQPAAVPSHARATGWRSSRRSCATTRTRTSSSTATGKLVYVQDAYTTSATASPTRPGSTPASSAGPRASAATRSTTSATASRSRSTPTTARCTSTSPIPTTRSSAPGRASSRRCSSRWPTAGGPAAAPPGPRGAVQRPDPGLRALPRHPAADVLQRDDRWTVPPAQTRTTRACRPRPTTS